MAGINSEIETSYASNEEDSASEKMAPPGLMSAPAPILSSNTHVAPNIIMSVFHLHSNEPFALPQLPSLLLSRNTIPMDHANNINGSNALSSNNTHSYKMRTRISFKNDLRFGYNNYKNDISRYKLRYAARVNNIHLLTSVLRSGADPNCETASKQSILHVAANCGNWQIVQQLLKFGAKPNVVDNLGNTPLHLAVVSASSNNFNLVVCALLEGGASAYIINDSGKTPMDLVEEKLRLLGNRCNQPTAETSKIFDNTFILTALHLRYMIQQQHELDDLSKRVQNLSTSEDQKQLVSQTDGELLASLERLSLNK